MDFIAGFINSLGGVLWSTVFLLLTFVILVVVHEYGHFYAARKFNVKVLRFSVGFGKVVWSKKDSRGTEFAISMLPLGGYVQMLGEQSGSEQGISQQEWQDQSLLSKPAWQRIIIAAAGPAANLLFAVMACWVLNVSGITTSAPFIGKLAQDSPAAQAGLSNGQRITSVDGRETLSWLAIALALSERLGDTGTLTISTQGPGEENRPSDHLIPLNQWLVGVSDPDPMKDIGLNNKFPPAIMGAIQPESPAARAGLQEHDQILTVDGQPVSSWQQWVEQVRNSPDQPLGLTVRRGYNELLLTLIPARRQVGDKVFGQAGVYLPVVHIRYGPIEAIGQAAKDTAQLTTLTLSIIKKLIIGLVSPTTMGGPLTIADAAGSAASQGFETFLYMLALLSISLGVINLLPIPVLDGGHILFASLEMVRGKPLSEKTQLLGLKIGSFFVLAIMFLVIFNDINRYIFQ